MAYDPDPMRKETILFGGFQRSGNPCVDGDTWAWDGSTWIRKDPATSPPARYGHTMAYDASNKQVVLFGGHDGTKDLNDTWTWDGSGWTRHDAPPGSPQPPSPRARAAMAYDGKQIVLFGGDRQGSPLGDTWVWNGAAWTDLRPSRSPSPRGDASMAYDPVRRYSVLVGGWDGSVLSDTWLWDGVNWQASAPINLYPCSGIDSGAMAFDPTGQKVALVWGSTGDPRDGPNGCRSATWDGTAWGSDAGPYPGSRMFPAMAPDANDGLVFFGGYGTGNIQGVGNSNADQDDTWTYKSKDPVVAPVPPPNPFGYGIEVTLAPPEVDADGSSKVTATATVTQNMVRRPARVVTFATDGDVTFSCPSACQPGSVVSDNGDGTYTTTIIASRTPDVETITASDSGEQGTYLPSSGSAQLIERGVVVTLDPASIQPDTHSTSTATATLIKSGSLADQEMLFRTDGDVTFSDEKRLDDYHWKVTITASATPGPETITATASPAGLSGSAVLVEADSGWFDRSPRGTDPAPSARDQSAMALDEARGQTVLFGGFADDRAHPFGDTWTWDGARWTQQHPPTSPPARWGHAMAYDAVRQQIVLFGGFANGYLGDTWTWDGTTWTEHRVASPSPRYRAAIAYDAARGNVVLFGGWSGAACDVDVYTCPAMGDTWTWDGTAWTDRTPRGAVSPPPPATSGPQRFSNLDPIVVPLPPPAPGCPGSNCLADTADPYPSDLTVSGLAGKVANVTVTLNNLSWPKGARPDDANGPADSDIMLVAPGGRAVMVMSDACGADSSPNPISKDAAITLTFNDAAAAGLSTEQPCGSGTYKPTNISTPECTPWHSPDAFSPPAPPGPNGNWSLYVVDDCPNEANPVGEAGRIDGGWTLSVATTDAAVGPPALAASPSPRGWAAMAYHPPSGKVVLYGGSQVFLCAQYQICGTPFNPLGDTWTWDGTTWAQEGMGTSPGLRHSAAMAFDRASGQLVLFGGADTKGGDVADGRSTDSTLRDDRTGAETWTWDGKGWAHQPSAVTPPSRHSDAIAQDPSGGVVMFGGFHVIRQKIYYGVDYSYLGDTWTFTNHIRVHLDRSALPADGASTATAVATVTGATGQAMAGLRVSFATSGDALFSAVADHGDGTYSATVTASSTDGFETITATTPSGSAATTLTEVVAAPCSASRSDPPGTWGSSTPMTAPRYGGRDRSRRPHLRLRRKSVDRPGRVRQVQRRVPRHRRVLRPVYQYLADPAAPAGRDPQEPHRGGGSGRADLRRRRLLLRDENGRGVQPGAGDRAGSVGDPAPSPVGSDDVGRRGRRRRAPLRDGRPRRRRAAVRGGEDGRRLRAGKRRRTVEVGAGARDAVAAGAPGRGQGRRRAPLGGGRQRHQLQRP